MKCKIIILSLIFITFLSACGDNSKDLEQGISLFHSGDYESLLKAEEFFLTYLELQPDSSEGNDWLADTRDEIITKGKEEVEKLYGQEKNIVASLEIMEKLMEIKPGDEEIKTVYEQVKADYDALEDFDKFARSIERTYNKLYIIFENYRTLLNESLVGKPNLKALDDLNREMLPKISSIREELQNDILNTKDKNYTDIQNTIFVYLNQLESDISTILIKKPENILEYENELINFSPQNFNDIFNSVQNNTNLLFEELDKDGNPLRNFENTLSFDREEIDDESHSEISE